MCLCLICDDVLACVDMCEMFVNILAGCAVRPDHPVLGSERSVRLPPPVDIHAGGF